MTALGWPHLTAATCPKEIEWNEGKLLWRLQSEPTFLYRSTDMYQMKFLHNYWHKDQSK